MGNPNTTPEGTTVWNEPGILVTAREGARPITRTVVTEEHLIIRVDGIRSLGYWVELRLTRPVLVNLLARCDAWDAAARDIEAELDVLLQKGPPAPPVDPPPGPEARGRVVTIPAAIAG